MSKIKLQKWLENEIEKDNIELELEKKKIIENIKSIKKEDIFKTKKEKQSLWMRIKKVLMG